MSKRSAEDLLKVLRSWVGYGRSNGKQKIIIDIYNKDDPTHLPRGYKVQYGDSYCDTTVSAAAIKAAMKDLIGKECGVEEHVKIFKKMGIWQEDGTMVPKAGYPIVYSWRKAVQPNDAYSDHIGVVESVKNGTIVAIEGNLGGEVKRRSIPVGWGYIRGYAIPKYESNVGQSSGESNNGGKTESGSTKLSKKSKWIGAVTVNSVLNVRKWAGIEYDKLVSKPELKNNNPVHVCDTIYDSNDEPWYYIYLDKADYGFSSNIYGFVKAEYIRKQ